MKKTNGGFIKCGAATQEWLPQGQIIVAVSIRDRQQYLSMLLFEQSDLLLSHTVTKVILAMTRRAKTDQAGVRVADIMISVGGMKIDRVAFPCAFGFPLAAVFDLAKLT